MLSGKQKRFSRSWTDWNEAYLYAETIDLTSYERQRDRLRQELTLTQIDKHSVDLEKFDVEGVLAFAERVLPRAADLWVQASLNQKQQLQQSFFGEGVAFDGKQFVRTAVTANAFKCLTAAQSGENEVASPMPASWNQSPAGSSRSTTCERRPEHLPVNLRSRTVATWKCTSRPKRPRN
jgi:hypothetical protein